MLVSIGILLGNCHVCKLFISYDAFQDVRLNGKVVPFFAENDTSHGLQSLEPPAQSVNIESGEKSDDVCATTNPCQKSGVCSNVFFNDFE